MQVDQFQPRAQSTGAGIGGATPASGTVRDADVTARYKTTVSLQHTAVYVRIEQKMTVVRAFQYVAVCTDAGSIPAGSLVTAWEKQLKTDPGQLVAQIQYLERRHRIEALCPARAKRPRSAVV